VEEKIGEAPELVMSGVPVVHLGLVTEEDRRWYEWRPFNNISCFFLS
jgi:hypothetical protein